jgi:hypothetical protein
MVSGVVSLLFLSIWAKIAKTTFHEKNITCASKASGSETLFNTGFFNPTVIVVAATTVCKTIVLEYLKTK